VTDKAESLVELARRDLAAATTLSKTDLGNAAFHLQQAAEKLAKAVLEIEGIESGNSHHIGALAAMLPADHVFRTDLVDFDRFSGFATQIRYPRPGGGLPREPDRKFLTDGIREVSSLVGEIDDYRREKDAPKPR
jgi:HEPN domain-containing protein